MSKETYAQARKRLLDFLESEGWIVKRYLKVPNAVSRNLDCKLFFRPQAVYMNEHSMHIDIRSTTNERFAESVKTWYETQQANPDVYH